LINRLFISVRELADSVRGAGDTANAAENWLKSKNIDAEIIKTGCIGLCSAEPIMDVQMPEMNRVSFENVTEGKS
jgi:NADH:ubiquinone oxidoreductase subunit E